MTWMDKYKDEHPDMTERDIIANRCPPDRCKAAACPQDHDGTPIACVECWNREIECSNNSQQADV